jgi:hypothetical protein
MFNEQRIRKNFIEGLSSISAKMDFTTEKQLKEYLWKQKDFYRLDLISEEENVNNSFLKEFILVNQ